MNARDRAIHKQISKALSDRHSKPTLDDYIVVFWALLPELLFVVACAGFAFVYIVSLQQ